MRLEKIWMRAARLRGVLLPVVFALLGGLLEAQGLAQHADRIFVNGKIWTGDDGNPSVEALAISGDKILAVGTTAEIRALASPDTAIVDLKGRLVLPGFQDSHLHFPGPSINSVRLDGIETLDGFQKELAEFAKSHPNLLWITG